MPQLEILLVTLIALYFDMTLLDIHLSCTKTVHWNELYKVLRVIYSHQSYCLSFVRPSTISYKTSSLVLGESILKRWPSTKLQRSQNINNKFCESLYKSSLHDSKIEQGIELDQKQQNGGLAVFFKDHLL